MCEEAEVPTVPVVERPVDPDPETEQFCKRFGVDREKYEQYREEANKR